MIPTAKPELPIRKTLREPGQQVVIEPLIDAALEQRDASTIFGRHVLLRPGILPKFVIAPIGQRNRRPGITGVFAVGGRDSIGYRDQQVDAFQYPADRL